ncbi:hypothetical protein ES703_110022 [subsurface metagenome]
MVNNLKLSPKLRVFILYRVIAMRAGGNYLLHIIILQQLNIFLSLHLEEVLVTQAASWFTTAGFLSSEDTKFNLG